MNNIELKLEVEEKLSSNLKTIAKEKAVSREHLSEEVLERYVDDSKDIWTSKVEQIKEKEMIRKERFKEESEDRIRRLEEKQLTEHDEYLDLIIAEDTYYHLALIAEKKEHSVEELTIKVLSDFTDDYRELLEEKDKQKKKKKENQKQQKILQREKKAQKKEMEKMKRKNPFK